MRQRTCRSGILTLFILLGAACGGGGGGTATLPPVTELATLKAILLGSLEVAVVDADAQASVLIDLRSDGGLDFACTTQTAWVGDIIGAHIHRGAPGVNGPIVIDLLGGGATFSATTLSAADTLSVAAALAAEIAATPSDFYVNVHTSAAPAGLVRQQLAPLAAIELHTTLLGADEVAVADADARGGATVLIGADKSLSYRLAMRQPAIEDIVNAHIHAAPAGVDGAVLIDLEPGSATTDPGTGLMTGAVTPTLLQLARVCNDLGAFYINVHTAAVPAGVARGQLTDGPVEFWARLDAANETTPPMDGVARGGAALHIESFTGGRAHLAVPLAQGIGSITSAHVHDGDAGTDGPVVIDLMAGADFVANSTSFSAEGSVTCSQDLLTRMIADPDAFYFNFHTTVDPGGVARAQLSQQPITLSTVLSGANEVTVVDPSAAGTASVVLRSMFDASFSIDMSVPSAATLTTGHVHDADAGLNGPVVIDLLGGDNVTVSGTFVTGDAPFTGRTMARLLAAPERFYVNVHTTLAPAGIARGQLAILDASTPPAGLAYASPVTYTEGVGIVPNLPTSTGGPIAGYTVSPALPAGLSLEPVTGGISGRPSVVSAAADYTVTGTNVAGTTSATVNITVAPVAPSGLTYATPVSYTVGTAITANTPSNGGGAITSYSVAPALPAGLSLSTTTGALTGTPTSATAAANYTVTGTNAAGTTTAVINITVNATLQAPSGLSYTTPVSYGTGTAITDNTPTISGGTVATWAIAPALPAGLVFSTTTGVISGTPSATSGAANYTVTATNASGSATATVNITVTLGAPSALSYSNSPNIGYVSTPIANMSPTAAGGAIASYSVSPALPAGISLNTTSGVISGTPTGAQGQTNYTVTATNATGSTTTVIQIIVY